MASDDYKYIRDLLDKRERWGIALSLSAIAGLFVFLSDHPPINRLVFIPVIIGAYGSLYIFVVNCYYKQAEAIEIAPTKNEQHGADHIKEVKWWMFRHKIGFLGWMHILTPLVVGIIVALALYIGIQPATNHECCCK